MTQRIRPSLSHSQVSKLTVCGVRLTFLQRKHLQHFDSVISKVIKDLFRSSGKASVRFWSQCFILHRELVSWTPPEGITAGSTNMNTNTPNSNIHSENFLLTKYNKFFLASSLKLTIQKVFHYITIFFPFSPEWILSRACHLYIFKKIHWICVHKLPWI